MIRIIRHWALLAVVLLSVIGIVGCTQNNGHIGPLFGTWKLDSMTINGEPDTEYEENVLWKFQSTLIDMVRLLGNHDQYEMYGTWSMPQDDVLQLTYIYSDIDEPVGSMKYSPLPETHLPKGISTLQIVELKSSKMRLEYYATDGTIYGYSFTKW